MPPERLLETLTVRGGLATESRIAVPRGLDDKIWFLRTEVGSATRFTSAAGQPQHVRIEADLELRGVPGFLAPTWEQWFDPAPPAPAAPRPQ